MPPEQALGGNVSARSDLYALGVMLYEMVSGRPPFVGSDGTAVISQHINAPPVAPSWHNDRCPPALETLILELLAKSPDERPRSAEAVLGALERVDPTDRAVTHVGAASHPLDRLARGAYVGRAAELTRMRDAFDVAAAGRGTVVLLSGEAGMGKTRQARELETYARLRGARVLWGRAHESAGAPPYWAWLQAGRAFGAAVDPDELRSVLGSHAAEIARIVPEVQTYLPGLVVASADESDAAQFRLFDAITTFLHNGSARAPLVLVLDDLHWADEPTLALLVHAARELGNARVLIVASYRDEELDRHHPLARALASLSREANCVRIRLSGLTTHEVDRYIRDCAGLAVSPELVATIAAGTEGNPFFLSEVVSLMAEDGTLAADAELIRLPQSVSEVLGLRLARLSDEAVSLLGVAAVIGRSCLIDLLTVVADESSERVLALLEQAASARVVSEGNSVGGYEFAHALMQDTLVAGLPTRRRLRLHGLVAAALEQAQPQAHARLALHFRESARAVGADLPRAARYSQLAAEDAARQSAWSEAVRHYRRCLELAEDAGVAETLDVAALHVALSRCERLAAEPRAAFRSAMRAYSLYLERGDGLAVAQAAIEALSVAVPRERVHAVVEQALAALAGADPHLEARLLVRRAGLLQADPSAEARAAIRKAADLAAEHDLPDIDIAVALYEANVAAVERRSDDARRWYARTIELANEHAMREPAMVAMRFRAMMLLQVGAFDELESTAQGGLAFARTHRLPYDLVRLQIFRSWIAYAREGRQAGEAMLADLPASHASVAWTRAEYALEAGAVTEALALLPDVESVDAAELPARLGVEARIQLHRGDDAAARAALDAWRQVVDQFDTGVVRYLFLASPAEALATLGSDELVRAVYDEVRGWAGNRGSSWRSLDHFRGLLALRLGEHDAAEQAFTAGCEWATAQRLPVEFGRCEQGLAVLRADAGDRSGALRLLDSAGERFRDAGVRLYLDQVLAKKLELQGMSGVSAVTPIDAIADSLGAEPPNLVAHAAPDGTVTILFSDIAGSTVLNSQLGDARWLQLLREHNGLVRRQVAIHGGFEVKTEGDGFMLAFGSARDALRCAAGIQRSLADRNARIQSAPDGDADTQIHVRVGVHTGEVLRDENDFFGRHVALAARIASSAQGDEMLVSTLVHELVAPSGEFSFETREQQSFKGFEGLHAVYALRWA